MGGNSSYNKTLDRVRGKSRTHQEFHHRIEGHKILLQNKNKKQVKLPVNSNSDSPIYLLGRYNKKGEVEVVSVGIYENHKCIGQIDLKFDKDGNFIPYSKDNKNSSHFHTFPGGMSPGDVGRKSHDKSNIHPIDSKYDSLIQKIVEFNKKGYK